MANYSTLKAAIADVVKTNGSQAITGANLQQVLLSVVNSLGSGYLFKGVATPSTDPGTPDQNVFYIAGAGTYSNFGTSYTVPVGSIGVFKYNGSWSSSQLKLFTEAVASDFANPNDSMKAKIPTVGAIIDGYVSGVYDVSARNGGTTFTSLGALLSDANLATLIPTQFRHGGMEICFVKTSDNKYVQYRLMSDIFNTTPANWQGVDDELTAGSENLITSKSIFSALNRFIETDENLSDSSQYTKVPDGVIKEAYFTPAGSGTYRLYYIARNISGNWIIRIAKDSGTYIYNGTLHEERSVWSGSFNDGGVTIRFWLLIDWSKLAEGTYAQPGYRWARFTSLCYDLQYCPNIHAKFLAEKDAEIEQEISTVDDSLNFVRGGLTDFEGKFYTFEKINVADLISAGNLVMNGTVGGGGIILESSTTTLYYYPVEAGKLYKLSSEISWYAVYIAAAFSENIPAAGGTFDEGVLSCGSAGEEFYIAPADGYILLLKYDNVTAEVFITDDFQIDLLHADINHLKNQIIEINKKLVDFQLVNSPTLLGNCYMNVPLSTIVPFNSSSVYYYPVEAGKIYKVTSEISNWNANYGAVGFSKNLPVIGNLYDETLLFCWTPSETYYIPNENGYILLAKRYNSYSYLYIPTDISLEQIQEEISQLQGGGSGYPPIKKDIVCSGSSITWGDGHLDGSMVSFVDKFIKERLSKTILAGNQNITYSPSATDISNWLLYGSAGKMISGVGATIEFDLFGNEIAICQAKRRISSAYGIMKVYADGTEIGMFDNKNEIKSATETFSGDAIREIKLAHPCTFNHQIYINGSSTPLTDVIINANSSAMPASGCNAWVFRGSDGDGSTTCHYIQFAESLGNITSVTVTYDYGRIIAHERSTIGQTDNEYTNEYVYGKGDVSYDPDQPTSGVGSGLEFKAIDRRAFFIYKFSEYKTRHFKIEIIDGTNPYFIFNFATNRYHNLMNAGIGGWELADLLHRNDKICHWTQFFKYWHPDILFEEAMTNDDWSYSTRRISRSIGEVTLEELQKMHQLEVHKITYNSVTDKYAVEMCTGIISSITSTSLISADIVGTNTQVGDIIRIGTYRSDLRQIVCRKLTEVNTTTGEVKWIEPLIAEDILMIDELSDLVGAEINIRTLTGYKNLYKELIESVHSVSPETKIIVVHNSLPNLWTRQLWGYEIIHAELCTEYENVEFIDARDHIYDTMFNTISGSRKETVVSTGASSYDLTFGGTQYGGWQGFKVLVNGVDVYGKDAYIQMDMAYRLNTNVSGANANKTNPYDRSKSGWNRSGAALKLYFTRNVPTVGDTIEVQYADTIWSNDFCHPTDFGAQAYGESYSDVIKQLV